MGVDNERMKSVEEDNDKFMNMSEDNPIISVLTEEDLLCWWYLWRL